MSLGDTILIASESEAAGRKRRKPVNHTPRTKDVLVAEGWQVETVERWCQFSRRRKDLFGFIDVIAIRGEETMGVQVTSETNHAGRRNKALGLEALQWWLAGGTRTFEIWSWAKRKGRWVVRRESIGATHED